MFSRSILASALLVGAAFAKVCTNMTVPVTISSRNGLFNNIATPVTNMDATQFALNSTRQGMNGTAAALTGYHTVSGTYQISAKYCRPSTSNMTMSSTPPLQILTHGIGFDKTYWDLSYNAYNYSYVDVALNSGYHTLSYDRLGIGNSSHGEPKNEIQSFLEVAALAELTRMMRNGTFPGVPTAYDTVIHAGHSFGSAQTYSLVAQYPDISDGIVLTGFSMNASFVPLFNAGNGFEQAYLNQPLRFGNGSQAMALNTLTQTYPALADLLAPIDVTTLQPQTYAPGYLVPSNAGNVNYLFLLNGYFDPMILTLAERTKQPVTVGEGLTLGSVPMMNPFSGPVLVLTGSNDVPYCGGDCMATGDPMVPSIPSQVAMNIPNAAPFTSHIQPNSGHGINLHYNATGAYNYIQNWLSMNNLGAS